MPLLLFALSLLAAMTDIGETLLAMADEGGEGGLRGAATEDGLTGCRA